jgi:tetratricopeptide (TPR) repeat protein
MGQYDLIHEIIDWHEGLRRTLSGHRIVRAIEERIEHETDPVKLSYLTDVLGEEHEAQGNHAEAQNIRRQSPYHEIDRWHHQLVSSNRGRKITPIIEKRLEKESNRFRIERLRWMLALEHQREGNYAAAEAIYLQEFEEDRDDPMPLISLAGQKLYSEEQPEEAMSFIDRAIPVAFRTGVFRRHALAIKARIALELKRYDIVEGILREILQLTFTRKNFDVGRERDILDRLPPGSIDSEVARQYDEYCRAKGKLPTGDPGHEPPEWDDADDET